MTTAKTKPKWLQRILPYLSLALFTGIVLFFLVYLKRPYQVCTSPGCIAAGERLFSSLNTSVDPCEDFAAYACDGWRAAHPIPIIKGSYSTIDPLFEKMESTVRDILEHQGRYKEMKKGQPHQSKAVQIELDLFRECMNMTARDARGLKPLTELLKDVLGAEWPALNESSLENSKLELQNGSFLKTLAQISSLVDSNFVYHYIEKDSNDTQATNVNFDFPKFFLTRKEFANADGVFNSEVIFHKRKIWQLMEFTLNSSFLTNSSTINETTLKTLDSRVKEVLALEKKLALAQLPEGSDDPAIWYNKMSLEEFETQTGNGNINYIEYLNELAAIYKVPHRFNRTDLVIVRDIAYYKQLSKTLAETPLLTLHNYLGYQVAQFFVRSTDNRVREFMRKLLLEPEPLWKECLNRVDSWVASQLYVDQAVPKETKEKTEEIAKELQTAFIEELLKKEVDWLDDATKKKALEKAARMHFYVAYPDWLLNGTAFDLISFNHPPVELPQVKAGHYFESFLEMTRTVRAVTFRKLYQPQDLTKDFPNEPYDANAFAFHERNVVAILAGFLHPPNFDPTVPAYVNLGALGSFIGHEISHHFDDVGALYDSNGNLVDWWSEETKKSFRKRSQCFVDQYESFVDAQTGIRLNGTQSLGENIGDNGGVRTAAAALEARLKKDDKLKTLKLPQLPQFSSHQIFFLSYAHLWCEHYTDFAKKKQIYHDSHVPGEYRINVPLSNFEQFSAVFNCPVGSKMNPVKKCRLW